MYAVMKREEVFTSERAENKAAAHGYVHGRKQERQADAPRLLKGELRLMRLRNELREQTHLVIALLFKDALKTGNVSSSPTAAKHERPGGPVLLGMGCLRYK